MGWVVKAQPLYPRERDLTPIVEEGWVAPKGEGVWMCKENLTLTGISSPDRLARTDYPIPACFAPYNLKLKNARCYTFSPSYTFVVWGLMKHRKILYFIFLFLKLTKISNEKCYSAKIT